MRCRRPMASNSTDARELHGHRGVDRQSMGVARGVAQCLLRPLGASRHGGTADQVRGAEAAMLLPPCPRSCAASVSRLRGARGWCGLPST